MLKHFLLFLLVVWLGGFIAFNYRINNYQEDNETKTDAIIVLTGGRNRITEATKLFNEGLAEKMFISGVQKGVSLKDISHSNSINIKEKEKVDLGEEAQNTVGNAIETIDWLNKNKVKSIRLVTSNYHIPRSLEEFKAKNKDLVIVINPVYSEHVSKYFWKNWGSFSLLALEYNKFLYVYIRNSLEQHLGQN